MTTPNEQNYRPLGPDEVIQEGDEYRQGQWRRPIPAEQEPKGEESVSVCPQCGAATVQPRDSETYCEECGWPDENRGDIIGQWQEAIRMKVIALTGCPDHIIDGAGCDSGDPLDFTLTEIALGFNYLNDQIFDLRAQLAESEKKRAEAEHIIEWIKTHFQTNGLTNEHSRDDRVYICGIHHVLMAAYHDVKKYVECNARLGKEIAELRTRAETAERAFAGISTELATRMQAADILRQERDRLQAELAKCAATAQRAWDCINGGYGARSRFEIEVLRELRDAIGQAKAALEGGK